jgi:hypothetical protein
MAMRTRTASASVARSATARGGGAGVARLEHALCVATAAAHVRQLPWQQLRCSRTPCTHAHAHAHTTADRRAHAHLPHRLAQAAADAVPAPCSTPRHPAPKAAAQGGLQQLAAALLGGTLGPLLDDV